MNKPYKQVATVENKGSHSARCPYCDYLNEVITECPTENSVCPHYNGIGLWQIRNAEKPYMFKGDVAMTFRKVIYIAGQMRGIYLYNFPAFDAAEAFLTCRGWKVINPASIDRKKRNFDPATLRPEEANWDMEPLGWEFDVIIREDIEELAGCDAIYMLRGWEKSTKGAHMEFAKSMELGLERYFQTVEEEQPLEEAMRLTNGARQGDYGHPAIDFAKQAKMWTGILLEKLKPSVEVTNRDVGLCMVAVKMSREVNKPKRDNITDGMGYLNCVNMIKEYEEDHD